MVIIEVARGADVTWIGKVTDKQPPFNVEPIGDCTFVFTAMRDGWKGTVFLQKTLALSDPDNGEAELTIASADTIDLENVDQDFVFDIVVTTVLRNKFPVCRGVLRVVPSSIVRGT